MPSIQGRRPLAELGTQDDRRWMGRFLARIHNVGRSGRFRSPRLNWRVLGRETADYLLDQGWIPTHIEEAYDSLADDVWQWWSCDSPRPCLIARCACRRCHPGNVCGQRRARISSTSMTA
jgi:hypothetical protein